MSEIIISVAMHKSAAESTAKSLGIRYGSVGINVNDSNGYLDDEATDNNWYVTFDGEIEADSFFGLSWEEIQRIQSKSGLSQD